MSATGALGEEVVMVQRVAVTSVPELQGEITTYGYDSRYRLYTAEHVAFDALPTYRDGGPARVAHTDWSSSTSSLCRGLSSPSVVAASDGRITINSTRGGHYEDGQYVVERHPLDGTHYATQTEANRATFEGGLTAFMVYERNAAKYGLPTVDRVAAAQA